MKCKACDHPELLATVTLTRMPSLAARGGSIKVGGVKVSQLDLKEVWETEEVDGEKVERKLRGPIHCAACGTSHFYVVGAKDPLFMGNYDEAVELGVEAFLEG